ncbi:MAG: N-acetylglucosamine-6-phosphate deacetylase [Oscillospiraceae bacterium]|nr:N-acetylglucosamine-6-phosphate deacetylase [Oscillospiraceae bacterium]
MDTVIKNVKIVTDGKVLEGYQVGLKDGKIAAVVPAHMPMEGVQVDGKGQYLSAGFVDIHVHGGGGADFMDGASAYGAACESHLQHGTTSIVPTTISADLSQTLFAVEQFMEAKKDMSIRCNLLGLHLEGPYLNPAMAGAMRPEQLKPPCEKEYMQLWEASQGGIIRWTAAPELEGAIEFGKNMAKQGVVMSIGHSDADYDTVSRAFDNGYSMVTHLYSACSSIKRIGGFRHAGIVEAAYLMDDLWVEIIADGCHLPNSLLQFVTKFKKPETVALITDAMRAAGQNVTESYLGSADCPQPVIIEDGVAKLLDRQAFGGSIATTDRLVCTMVQAGTPLPLAVQMMTQTPISFVAPKLKKGRIAEGYDADLILFNENIDVTSIYLKGEKVK